EATIKDLKKALELYKGDLMPDLRYESWIEDTRTNLKEKYLDIVYILSEKLYNNNEYMEAKLYLKKGIDEKIYREEYYNLAMKILAKTGRIYEAISLFVEYKKLIKEDLGIEPSTDILKTHNKIRQNDIIEKETVLEEKNKGAFRCDIDVFKNIYELEERQTNRSSNSFILMEIDFSDFDIDNKFADICKEIGNLFRSGDVICCWNKKIHLILHDLSIEKTNFTLKRIFDYLKEKNIDKKPTFDFKEISK
ncbi:MAG: bacterial transcriptional activator domain-containing protein, partial [Candidatus Cloacimonetes bacterium]|nr:bacterial transcriptional activator domain-containing protein [Candidatus Cloacimonadota bacterium]